MKIAQRASIKLIFKTGISLLQMSIALFFFMAFAATSQLSAKTECSCQGDLAGVQSKSICAAKEAIESNLSKNQKEGTINGIGATDLEDRLKKLMETLTDLKNGALSGIKCNCDPQKKPKVKATSEINITEVSSSDPYKCREKTAIDNDKNTLKEIQKQLGRPVQIVSDQLLGGDHSSRMTNALTVVKDFKTAGEMTCEQETETFVMETYNKLEGWLADKCTKNCAGMFEGASVPDMEKKQCRSTFRYACAPIGNRGFGDFLLNATFEIRYRLTWQWTCSSEGAL